MTLNVSWTAPDPGPPYSVAFALARANGSELLDLRSLLADHLPVIGWIESCHGDRVATAITRLHKLSGAENRLGRSARELSVLVVTDGPFRDLGIVEDMRGRILDVEDALRRLGCSEGGVAGPVEVAAVTALRTIPLRDRVAYVRATLGLVLGLPQRRAERLLETLDGMTDDLRIHQLAERLCVHERTIRERRRNIARLTSLRPWIAGERFHLVLAFFLWQLDRDQLPDVGSNQWSFA